MLIDSTQHSSTQLDLLSTLPGYVFWKDLTGRYLGCNSRYAQIAGLNNCQAIINMTDDDLPWRSQADHIKAHEQSVIHSKQPHSIEISLITASRKRLILTAQIDPLFDHNHQLVGTITLALDAQSHHYTQTPATPDVEKQRIHQAEKKALTAENYLNSIIDILPSSIFWKDLNGTYLGANKAARELITICCPEATHNIIGSNDFDFYDKKIAQAFIHNDQQVIKQGKPISFEEILRFPNQTTTTYISNKAPLRNEEGDIIGIVASCINITNQKQKEHSLQAQKSIAEHQRKTTEIYLANILNTLPEYVFWQDKTGRFLGCNDQLAIGLGLQAAEQIVNKTIDDIATSLHWDKDIVKQMCQHNDNVLRSGKSISAEYTLTLANGKKRTLFTKKTPLRDNNHHCIGLLGMAFDITERKEIEKHLLTAKKQAIAANEAKTNFIANISHDLRSPLHTMLGTAELLSIKPHLPEQERLIHIILEAGQTLLKLIKSTLSYTEAQAGHDTHSQRGFDLRHLIEDIVNHHKEKTNTNKLQLLIAYSDNAPRHVISNQYHVRRIIMNLVENALKFTKQGYILIAVELIALTKDSTTLQIIVEDTGIGIDKDNIEHIFERFYRATPNHHHSEGTGLGLAITKQLTHNLNGNLTVNSQLGIGTTFCCTLPFKLVPDQQQKQRLQTIFNKARVLVIDDNKQKRDLLLTHLPTTIKAACPSESAIDVFLDAEISQRPFNLIIIDDMICQYDANQLATKLADYSSLATKPLIIMLCNTTQSPPPTRLSSQVDLRLSQHTEPAKLIHALIPPWQQWHTLYQRKSLHNSQHGLHVLLVEDDALIRRFTTSVLQETGCQITIAKTGQEAISSALKQRFDIILMDIGLPDRNGLEVARAIRQNKTPNRQTPMIALTAHASSEHKEECLAAGLDDFITKPASVVELQEILNRYR